MSQSSAAASTAPECASAPSSTGSAAVLPACTSASANDLEDTTATTSATTSVFAGSSTDGDADASASPALHDDSWSLAGPLSHPSTVTATIATATDAPHQAPEALPGLQLLPSSNSEQLHGLTSDTTGTASKSCTMLQQTLVPVSLSSSHGDPCNTLVVLPSSPPRVLVSAASSSICSNVSTSQQGIESSLPTVSLAASPESSDPFVSSGAAGQEHHSDTPGQSSVGALSTPSSASFSSKPLTTAETTRTVACDFAEPTTGEEHSCLGISLSTGGAVTLLATCGSEASPGGSRATHSPSLPPLALDVMPASVPEEGTIEMQLPATGKGDVCTSAKEVPLGTTEARAALKDAALAPPVLSLSSVVVEGNPEVDPKAKGGASVATPNISTPLPTRPTDAVGKLTVPAVALNSDMGDARHDGNDGTLRVLSAEPRITEKPTHAPLSSRKRHRAALAGLSRPPRRLVRETRPEEEVVDEARAAPSFSAQPEGGLLPAIANSSAEICYTSDLITTYTPVPVSAPVQCSGDEGAPEEKRLAVLRPPEVAEGRFAGDVDIDRIAVSEGQEELPEDAQEYVLLRGRTDDGEQSDAAEDLCQTVTPVIASSGHDDSNSGEETSAAPPPLSSVATCVSAAAGGFTTTPVAVSNLTTETSAPTAELHNAKPKTSLRAAYRTAAASRKDSGPGAMTKVDAPAGSPPASRPVLNLAGANVQALLAESTDPPPLFTRRQRRTRRRPVLAEDHPLFSEHRDLWEHDTAGRIFPRAPFSSDADVLTSLTEWTDSPPLVYAQLLWRYTPTLFLKLAMRDSDATL